MTAQSGRTFPASNVVAPKTPPVSLSLLAVGLRRRDENWSACTVEPKLPIRDFPRLKVARNATSFAWAPPLERSWGGMPLAFEKHQ